MKSVKLENKLSFIYTKKYYNITFCIMGQQVNY